MLDATLGRADALTTFIDSLSHEVVHYRQCVETGDFWERGVYRRASAMPRCYEKTVDHP